MAITTVCTHCSTTLNLKSDRLLGKTIQCPKCGDPFVVKPTDTAELLLSGEQPAVPKAEFGGAYQGAASSGVTKRKKNRSLKKRFKRLPREVKWGVGGFLGIVLLVSGFIGLTSLTPMEGPNLAWLPADTELFIRLDADTIAASQQGQVLLKEPICTGLLRLLKDRLDLRLDDIDLVTVGIAGPSSAGLSGSLNVPYPRFDTVRVICVLRLHEPIGIERFEKLAEFTPAKHDGADYFRAAMTNADGGEQALAVFFPDEKTVVIGAEKECRTSIATGGSYSPATAFRFVKTDRPIVLAFAPSDKRIFDEMGFVSEDYLEYEVSQADDITAVSYSVKLNEPPVVETTVLYLSASLAEEAAERVHDDIGSVRKGGLPAAWQTGSRTNVGHPAEIKQMRHDAVMLMEATTAEQRGTQFIKSMRLSGELYRKAIEEAASFISVCTPPLIRTQARQEQK